MKLKTLAGIVALSAMTMTGCETQPQTDHVAAYTQTKFAAEAQTQNLEAEMEITDVFPGAVPFHIRWGNASIGSTHPFVWVMGTAQEKPLTFIYPYSAGIRKGHARITYRPLNGGITSLQFLADYNNNVLAGPDVFLQADGIILKDGIKRGE